MATRRKTIAAAAPAPMPEPTVSGNRFTVPEYLTHVSHGDAVYPVVDGVVTLPAGEDWYKPLVACGDLKPAE